MSQNPNSKPADGRSEPNETYDPERALEADAKRRLDEADWPFFLVVAWLITPDGESPSLAWSRRRQGGLHVEGAEAWRRGADTVQHELRAGALTATGLGFGELDRRDIPAVAWHDLFWRRAGAAEIVTRRGRPEPVYLDVLISAGAVRKRWPRSDCNQKTTDEAEASQITAAGLAEVAATAITAESRPSKAVQSVKLRAAAEDECQGAIETILEANADRLIAKAKLKAMVELDLGRTLTQRGFARAFTRVASRPEFAAWSAAGRRKKPNAS